LWSGRQAQETMLGGLRGDTPRKGRCGFEGSELPTKIPLLSAVHLYRLVYPLVHLKNF